MPHYVTCTNVSGKPMRTIILILITVLSGQVKSQTAEEILDRYYISVGTKEKWTRINSRIDKIETVRVSDMLNHGKPLQTNKTEITYKFSKRKNSIVWDRFVSIDSPGDTSTSCFNGTNYWTQKSNKVANDFDYYANRYAKFANLGYPDLLLRADKYEFIGNKKIDENICNVIRITIEDLELDYYFDSETNYLTMYHQKGKDLQTKLSDYRNVDGLMIPFKEDLTNSYGFVSSNRTVEIKINPLIQDMYFSKQIGLGLLIK